MTMQRNCLNCHFLCKSHREENSGRELTFALKQEERATLKDDPVGFDRGWYALKCHMGVWDEGLNPVAASEDKTLFSQDRKSECFFINYKPSMLMPAAIELQKREYDLRHTQRNQKLTIAGLYIAGFGLLVNAAVSVWRVFNC